MVTGLASIEALLTACAAPAAPAPPASAYVPSQEGATETTAGVWQLSGGAVKAVLCGPQGSGPWPLVVYLPGLGEPSDAGERWRVAWASAGYMVLSVQLLGEDASAWTSELARNGDFKALGQERFADSATRQRIGALLEVLAQARRNADAGPWRRIDWNRIAVAGFDLGAHTAMAIAGERVAGMDTPLRSRLPAIRAALALSPHAAAKAELDTRYADIRVPVLGVTGDLDTDPLGLLADARQRAVPFEHMRGPDKYLLSLQGLRHADLSGNATLAANEPAAARSRGASSGDAGNGQRNRGGRRKADASQTPQAQGAAEVRDDPGMSATMRLERLRTAQGIATAFLDASVKGDPRAQAWLATRAGPSLGTSGELLIK